MLTLSNIVDSIYITEGGTNTSHPYGILTRYKHTSPRQACANTVTHAMRDFKFTEHSSDKAFIYFLADRYCPTSADAEGNKNWKVNMVRILNIK
jgi:hypothetical protein